MRKLYPDYRYKNIQSIELEKLNENGIEGIVLDLDNTLIDYTKHLSQDVINWVNKAKIIGFKVCILSNTNNIEKVQKIAKELELEYINSAKKPFKKGFYDAMGLLELSASKIAVVGDQLFTDIIGANNMNMLSIYVDPINKKEHWYTRWKRPIESLILKRRKGI